MEDRDPELPVATLRGRGVLGKLAAARGGMVRWVGDKRRGLDGRSLPLVLTGLVFCAMMLVMSQVADRAQRAGAAIDEMHRDRNAWSQVRHHGGMLFRGSWTTTDPWSAATPRSVEPFVDDEPETAAGAGAATTAVGRNAALFYIVAGRDE